MIASHVHPDVEDACVKADVAGVDVPLAVHCIQNVIRLVEQLGDSPGSLLSFLEEGLPEMKAAIGQK